MSSSVNNDVAGGEDAVMPIAIIGVAGRFPGDAANPRKLWDMIAEGRSALSEIPADRFNVDAYYHPYTERQGTMNVRKAHFMQRDIKAFDAPFFSLPIGEAMGTDPQQRMALECTYEALENAGIPMECVDGSNTSCFIGCFTRDYGDMIATHRTGVPRYHSTGSGTTMMANRVSWFFNLKGASVTLDTACSSSLAALHLACQSLRAGETNLSVVGGTNVMFMPDIMGAMTRVNFLSPDGKCQSFDHKANGYSRGEGAAFCVLKPLHLAIKDGDVIRGVIRNSLMNQDGHTPGITQPSSEAQETLIRQVYAGAGLDFANTGYVEAHGTGTAAGDPIEARALGATFGKSRAPGNPVYIGSIKSNIGHLEAASGLVQVVKGIMMLEHGMIAPSIWYEKPNPRIPMGEWNLRVPTELIQWPTEGLRRISINSFGYGGTNAHCIIDDAYHYMLARGIKGNHNVQGIEPTPSATPDSAIGMSHSPPAVEVNALWSSIDRYMADLASAQVDPSPKLLMWTSNEQSGLERTSAIYSSYLQEKHDGELSDKDAEALLTKFARTLATRRSILPWKSFAVAGSVKDAISQLQTPPVKAVRSSTSEGPPKVAFAFTGQGAQWFAMGRDLYAHPVFRESLEASGRYLVSIGASWSLVTEMFRDEATSKLEQPDLSQPVCTALQVAAVDLMKTWGLKPAAVVGHSSGEIAAAYAKGAITREDAWKIAYHRGHLSSCIRGFAPDLHGGMLATGIGAELSESYIARLSSGNATVACINSPASTTISGDAPAIDELEKLLKADGHFVRKLRINVAYHSHHMQVIAAKYRAALGNIRTLVEDVEAVKMFSSLTGGRASNSDFNAAYWVANLVSQVKFSPALEALLKFSEGTTGNRRKKSYVDHIIEIGPHSALRGPIKQILNQESLAPTTGDILYQSLLERGRNSCETALTVAGRLIQHGYPISIAAVNNDGPSPSQDGFLVDIPPYGWNHTLKYWTDSHDSSAHRFKKAIRTDLLGEETKDVLPNQPRFHNVLRANEVPWTIHHQVQSTILYPASGMMIAAIEGIRAKADPTREIEGYELRDVSIGKAIVVPQDEDGIEIMLTMKPFRPDNQTLPQAWQEFSLYSRKTEWELHCSGLIRLEYKSETSTTFADEVALETEKFAAGYKEALNECTRGLHVHEFYEQLDAIGQQYSGPFRNLVQVRKGDFRSVCQLQVPDTKAMMPMQYEFPHVIHPATLDGIVQMALPASCLIDEDITTPAVPISVNRLYVSADVPSEAGALLAGYAKSRAIGFDEGESVVVVSHEEWSKPLVIFDGIKARKLAVAQSKDDVLAGPKIGTYFHWQHDITLMEKKDIRDLCLEYVGDRGQDEKKDFLEFEMACLIYAKRAVQAIPQEDVKDLQWHMRLFYNYMQHKIAQAKVGDLPYQVDTPGLDWLNMPPEQEEEILARVAVTGAGGPVLTEHGEHLPQILRGEIAPLQILMQNEFLDKYYSNGAGSEQCYTQITWVVDMMAHKNPCMNILEIGAGTAGATLPILTKLGGLVEGTAARLQKYTFTDISTGYFEKAQDKLAPWLPFLKFQRLNIEEDPVPQGFEEGTYDLIVAANVLHATRSISKSLEHTRKLLKPDGILILPEVTPNNKMRYHMLFGALEGWWYGEEDGRLLGPTLEVPQWDVALRKAGFEGIDVDFQDFADVKDCSLSVMVASAAVPAQPTVPEEVLIVLPDTSDAELTSCAEKVRKALTERGSQVEIVSFQEAAKVDVESKGVISLVDAVKGGTGFLSTVTEQGWDDLKRLIMKSRQITYVTRGGTVQSENPFCNTMTGMARSARAENYDLALTTLDAEYDAPIDSAASVASMVKIFLNSSLTIESTSPDWEFAIRGGLPMIQRVLLEDGINRLALSWSTTPTPELAPFKQEGRPLALGIGVPGRVETLRWEDDKLAAEPFTADDVEITVKAVGLNYKDVLVAMGQLTQPALGLECAGIVKRVGSNVKNVVPGDRVMTWKLGTFGNRVYANAAMVQPVPSDMDLAAAASIPTIYSTAHYALSHVARLQRGETILVQSAAGGVGQAAIMLAQHIGATVFATVSSESKKALLMETYGLPAENILNSRDSEAFTKAIMRLTNNRGVDVVLNSLAGESLRAGWHCIARFGRFIELGLRDIVSNMGLDMAPFERNVSFHSVQMLAVLDYDLKRAAQVFAEVAELFRIGAARLVKPITVFPASQTEEAFRMMLTGKHVGKIVIETNDDDMVPAIPASLPPYRLRGDATYIIVGGSGGLGRRMAAWMVEAGARYILLLSRSGDKKDATKALMARLSKDGANVAAPSCDIGNEEQFLEVLAEYKAAGWPAVRGVIQGAMNLRDSIYENMTLKQYNECTVSKVQGTWYLHKHLPKDMDFFILLSSVVGVAGTRGQGNYAAGNAYLDAIAKYRRARGLAATSIDLGVISGVGFLAEETTGARVHDNVKTWSFITIPEKEVMAVFEAAVRNESLPGIEVPPQLITGLSTGGKLASDYDVLPWWFKDAKFAHIVHVDTHQVARNMQTGGDAELSIQLAQINGIDEAVDLVTEALVKKLAAAMMVSVDDIEASKPVNHYGVDSLIAVELRSWVQSQTKVEVSVFDLLSNRPISDLARQIVETLKPVTEVAAE